MSAWVLGAAAAAAVLAWTGWPRRFPWRIDELFDGDDPAGARRPPSRAPVRWSIARAGGPPGPWRSISFAPADHLDADRPPEDLVEVVDRLHVAVSAGHSLHTAVSAVAAASPGPLGYELRRVDAACRDGAPLGRALESIPDALGRSTEPLVATLGAALRAGASAGPALQRLADTERTRRRRRAEARVRRLPVLLLVPLVTTVLPSFVLLTVVPVGLTTARSGLLGIAP